MHISPKTLNVFDVSFEPFPTIAREPDISRLVHVFNRLEDSETNPFGVIEKVSARPGQGVVSMFKFGRAYGIAQAMYVAYGMSVTEVTPQKWQKEMFEGIPFIYKKNKTKDTKKMSLLAASRLFPQVLIAKDWQADSLLLAEYYRRNLFGQKLRNINEPKSSAPQ